MKKGILLVLMLLMVVSVAVFAGQKNKSQADYDKCLKACKDKCEKLYGTCMKNAKTDPAKKACQQSKDSCNSDCLNKACSK